MIDVEKIVNDAKSSLEQGKEWVEQVVDQHLPQLLAFGHHLACSETGKALQELGDALLPPEFDQAIAAMIRFAGKTATAATATAATDTAATDTTAAVEQPVAVGESA